MYRTLRMSMPRTMSTESLCRQNYAAETEAAINKQVPYPSLTHWPTVFLLPYPLPQVNIELYASYVYLSMSAYFDRDDVALHNVAKFMRKSSDEEREHAIGLMKYGILSIDNWLGEGYGRIQSIIIDHSGSRHWEEVVSSSITLRSPRRTNGEAPLRHSMWVWSIWPTVLNTVSSGCSRSGEVQQQVATWIARHWRKAQRHSHDFLPRG